MSLISEATRKCGSCACFVPDVPRGILLEFRFLSTIQNCVHISQAIRNRDGFAVRSDARVDECKVLVARSKIWPLLRPESTIVLRVAALAEPYRRPHRTMLGPDEKYTPPTIKPLNFRDYSKAFLLSFPEYRKEMMELFQKHHPKPTLYCTEENLRRAFEHYVASRYEAYKYVFTPDA